MQLIKQKEEEKKINSKLREEFNSLKEKEITPLAQEPLAQKDRLVKLVFSSCCGCGCKDISLIRKVEFDSELQDGDRTSELQETDVIDYNYF